MFDNILEQETVIDAFKLYNISFENYEALVCKCIPVFTRMISVQMTHSIFQKLGCAQGIIIIHPN